MGISMEKAVEHQLLQVAGGAFLGNRDRINAALQQRLAIGDFGARQIVQAEHATCGQLPDDRRYAHIGVIQKLLAKASRMLSLQAEIQLPQQHPPAFAGHGHPIAAAPPIGVTLQHSSHLLHHLQIEAEELLQPRPLQLQHHIAAAVQGGAMHLSQAGGTQWPGLDPHDLAAARPQLRFQQSLRLRKRKRRHPILQLRQLLHPGGWQQIRPGREQLPQLDEGRTQTQQFVQQPAGQTALTPLNGLLASPAQIGPLPPIPPKAAEQHHHDRPDAQRAQHTAQSRH